LLLPAKKAILAQKRVESTRTGVDLEFRNQCAADRVRVFGIYLRFSRQLEAILSLSSNKCQYCPRHSRGALHVDGSLPIRRLPFALDTTCNPSIPYGREYSGINALSVEPSQDAFANHSYAVAFQPSRFEIDSVDSVLNIDNFMSPW